jgi:hypothetical protein
MIACVLALALIAAAIGQETTSTTSTIASTTTEMQSESTSTMASSTTSNDSSNSDSLTTTNATTFNDASTTTIDASISSIDTNDGSLTTTTTSLSNGTTSGRECLSLPVELKTAAFGCEVDFRLWRVDCKKDIPLPNRGESRRHCAGHLRLSSCVVLPTNTLQGTCLVSICARSARPRSRAPPMSPSSSVPDGNQIASRTVPINVTGSRGDCADLAF